MSLRLKSSARVEPRPCGRIPPCGTPVTDLDLRLTANKDRRRYPGLRLMISWNCGALAQWTGGYRVSVKDLRLNCFDRLAAPSKRRLILIADQLGHLAAIILDRIDVVAQGV
jgi:hypothetical protein